MLVIVGALLTLWLLNRLVDQSQLSCTYNMERKKKISSSDQKFVSKEHSEIIGIKIFVLQWIPLYFISMLLLQLSLNTLFFKTQNVLESTELESNRFQILGEKLCHFLIGLQGFGTLESIRKGAFSFTHSC